MTEQEWLKCCLESERMLNFVLLTATERKLRLFACSCCRRLWDLRFGVRERPAELRAAVEIAEHFADGQASSDEMTQAGLAVPQVAPDIHGHYHGDATAMRAALAVLNLNARICARDALWSHQGGLPDMYSMDEDNWRCNLLRCIVGNPFSPISVDDQWLTASVRAIAQNMYDERQFQNMPILGDALEDAGCTQENILDHCRSNCPDVKVHVRGCWAVDLVLGKK